MPAAYQLSPQAMAAHLGAPPWNPGDPLIPQYKMALSRVADSSEQPGKNPGWYNWGLVDLQSRRHFYFKSKPGDCGSPSGASGPSAIGLATYSAGTADQLAGVGASIAGASVSAIPIIGGIVGGIEAITSIFSHHSQAVATEQAINCQVSVTFNQYAPQVDAAVASGQLTPAQGLQNFTLLVNQLCGALKGISHVENLSEGVQHLLLAQYQFRVYWYPTLAAAKSNAANPTGAVAGGTSTNTKLIEGAAAVAAAHFGGLF